MEKNTMQCGERGLRCLRPAHFAQTFNYSNGTMNPFLWAEQSLLSRSSRSNSFGRFSVPACCSPPFVGRSTKSEVFSWRTRVLPAENAKTEGTFVLSSFRPRALPWGSAKLPKNGAEFPTAFLSDNLRCSPRPLTTCVRYEPSP